MDSHVDHEFFSLSDLAMQSTTTHVVCEDGQGSQERRSDLGEALQPPNARADCSVAAGTAAAGQLYALLVGMGTYDVFFLLRSNL